MASAKVDSTGIVTLLLMMDRAAIANGECIALVILIDILSVVQQRRRIEGSAVPMLSCTVYLCSSLPDV